MDCAIKYHNESLDVSSYEKLVFVDKQKLNANQINDIQNLRQRLCNYKEQDKDCGACLQKLIDRIDNIPKF